ncbi:MAG: family 1 encapsulin nanocompartment shell protein [Bacteroidales bacterium]
MDILRRSLAPVSDQAWEEINEEARETIETALSARRFVDVEGPKGLDFAAVPLGKLNVPARQNKKEVQYGVHQLLPVIEARIPFELDIWELDNMARGNEDIDLDNVQEAALKMAEFEEKAIYHGFKQGNIEGLMNSSEHSDMELPEDINMLVEQLSKAIVTFRKKGVHGPFHFVVGPAIYQKINSHMKGYPLRKQVEKTIEGDIILAHGIENALLVSAEDGNFRLSLGQDFAVGYESHNNKKVQLYLTESFTFQVLDPAALMVFK